jgi:3-mercaptopyruvate sulfurtransferase SseA
MRSLTTTMVVASLFSAGIACAQMKAPAAATPNATSTAAIAPQPTHPEPSLESARRITQDEAIKMVDQHKAIFVDVRPKDAYDQEHIKGAINIPLSDLAKREKELPKNKFIVTYCA